MAALQTNYQHPYKILLVGDTNVGKSSILSQFANSNYNGALQPTIVVDVNACNLNVDGKTVKLQIWDTAGQERFRSFTKCYYRGAKGILLVYDCCDMSTLKHIRNTWLADINRYASEKIKIVLVGNKCDHKYAARSNGVDTEAILAEAKVLAEEEGFHLVEASAKHNKHIDTAFLSLARELQKQDVLRLTAGKTVKVNSLPPGSGFFAKLCSFLKPIEKR